MNYAENLFRQRYGFAKGDSPKNETQSSADTYQTDYRVGAAENGVAVGAGGFLDQSFSDSSQTTLNTSDNRDQSTHYADNSQTTLNTSDNRDQSVSYVDNSVHNDLSGEILNQALNTGAAALKGAGSVLEAQVAANQDALSKTAALLDGTTRASLAAITSNNDSALSLVGNAVETLLDKSAEQTAALAEQQTSFLSSFYKDRQSSDLQAIDSLAKYAAGAVAFGALAWALK